MHVYKKTFGATDFDKLSNEFNNTFITKIQDLRNQVNSMVGTAKLLGNSTVSAYLPQMTESDVDYIVNNMSITKPAGFDEIRFRDIKHNIDCLKRVLLAIKMVCCLQEIYPVS